MIPDMRNDLSADIEAGRANGSVQTLRGLADALGISVDDISPV